MKTVRRLREMERHRQRDRDDRIRAGSGSGQTEGWMDREMKTTGGVRGKVKGQVINEKMKEMERWEETDRQTDRARARAREMHLATETPPSQKVSHQGAKKCFKCYVFKIRFQIF